MKLQTFGFPLVAPPFGRRSPLGDRFAVSERGAEPVVSALGGEPRQVASRLAPARSSLHFPCCYYVPPTFLVMFQGRFPRMDLQAFTRKSLVLAMKNCGADRAGTTPRPRKAVKRSKTPRRLGATKPRQACFVQEERGMRSGRAGGARERTKISKQAKARR